jgi:hypothetical protein
MTDYRMTETKFSEPFLRTFARTVGLALLASAIFAWRTGRMNQMGVVFLVVLWFTFGGHWVEIFYLNWLRQRLPESNPVRMGVRIALWFVGGMLLGLGAVFTATHLADHPPSRIPPLWLAGAGFVAIEMFVHLPMAVHGRPSFYNGRA